MEAKVYLYRILLLNMAVLISGPGYVFCADNLGRIDTPGWFNSLLDDSEDDRSGSSSDDDQGDSQSYYEYDSDGFDPIIVSRQLGKHIPDDYDFADDDPASDSEDELNLDDAGLDATGYTPENNPDLYARLLAYSALKHRKSPAEVKVSKAIEQEIRRKMQNYADIADMYVYISQQRLAAHKKLKAVPALPLDMWDEIALAGKI